MGRRNLSRVSSHRPPQPLNDDLYKYKCGSQGKLTAPKHIRLPKIVEDSALMFEIVMFVFTYAATFFQFLNLYRSVWWLPHSHTSYTMNFYLINPYLVGFISTVLGCRLLYRLIWFFTSKICPTFMKNTVQKCIRVLLLIATMSVLLYCTYQIMQSHPIVSIFYLCYPISVYFILFGVTVQPLFDIIPHPTVSCDEEWPPPEGKTMHICSTSPQVIRDEVEYFKTDFNNRMKQVLFSSVMNAYYAGFVPCCFVQNFLYYDVNWATQHLTFTWLSCFIMYFIHLYPIRYYDTLHRAALHLGKWTKVESRMCHIPSHTWTDSTLWPQGALVRHSKELFKAEGITNAAEPGNISHTRFFLLFNDPTTLLYTQVALQFCIVMLQVGILLQASEWYHILSLMTLLFINYYPLFRLGRDFLVSWKMYRAEAAIQAKANS
ncbi:unnamed protein product [Bemisia tabaci]|uniref:Transmembrane protein 39A n=1 Tax=Bemisia tabaci TaxID=7038 RepID=A0A9P0F274_BEMTA|nr:PREDICTED: transmembrane protein 39A-like [Bemisia tabaci]CAH0385221.1 unnamed protein product [Bemisia tabaci]